MLPEEALKTLQKAPNLKATCASGNTLDILGQIVADFSIFGQNVRHRFFVCKNLSISGVCGVDLIRKANLIYNPRSHQVYMENSQVTLQKEVQIPPRSAKLVAIKTQQKDRFGKDSGVAIKGTDNIAHNDVMVHWNGEGQAMIYLINESLEPLHLNRGTPVGDIFEVFNATSFNDVMSSTDNKPPPPSIFSEADKRRFIEESGVLRHLSHEQKLRYQNLLVEYFDILSTNEYDLGQCTLATHKIHLKDPHPTFSKQFPIPAQHLSTLQDTVKEWLRVGVVEPSNSEWSSPIFLVPKRLPNGTTGWRPVIDYRTINSNTHPSGYRLPLISECIDQIGRDQSCLFSQLDLRAGFHQMGLEKASRPISAFYVPGMGQYQFRRAPMGLANMPLSFQRLIDSVFRGLTPSRILCYLDDLLVKSSGHEDMLHGLQQCFERLRKAGLKLNLDKCRFGVTTCEYLGFQLGKEGYQPSKRKVLAISEAKPPSTIKEVRQFLGLTNFFRMCIPQFARISKPLSRLTCKNSGWTSGNLPQDALSAFQTLQKLLCSEPVLTYPNPKLPYHLYCDASQGNVGENNGGLGACLVQYVQGIPKVVAYASRSLQKHEANYTPYLLELLACTWGIDHFRVYLTGTPFTLHTDHRPLERLSKTHTRTLNRLQQQMLEFNFTVEYIEGSKNPSDYCSRNVPLLLQGQVMAASAYAVTSMDLQEDMAAMAELQRQDPLCIELVNYCQNGKMSKTPEIQRLIRKFGQFLEIKNGLLFCRKGLLGQPLVWAPAISHGDLIANAHAAVGHKATYKTLTKIMEAYFWPNMAADVNDYIRTCWKCDKAKTYTQVPKAYLKPLQQPQGPFERVHADLFGPLKASDSQKKFILVITDTFTKMAEFVALPNKTPEVVAHALVNRWILRYGSPYVFVTDQGPEFVSKLNQSLFTYLQIDKRQTAARHPATNGACEIINKHIADYLKKAIEESPLDWEVLLPALQLSYNSAANKATKVSPFFLLYGVKARTPFFDPNQADKIFYGEDYTSEIKRRMALARKFATEENLRYIVSYKHQHDKNARPEVYNEGSLVWLHRPDLLKVNPKIQSEWEGPYIVVGVRENNVLIQHLATHKTRFESVHNVRPFRPEKVHQTRQDGLENAPTLSTLEPVSRKNAAAPNSHSSARKAGAGNRYITVQDDEVVILNPYDPAPLPIPLKTEPEASLQPVVSQPAPQQPTAAEADRIEIEPGPSPSPNRPIKTEVTSSPETPTGLLGQLQKFGGKLASPLRDLRNFTTADLVDPIVPNPARLPRQARPKSSATTSTSTSTSTAALTRTQARAKNITLSDPPLSDRPIEYKKYTKKK